MKTIEAARGKWFGVLTHFGVDGCFLQNRHGPCPLCGGKDRYRWDDKDGSGSYFCSQCGAGTGMQLLMEITGWDFREAANAVDEVLGNIEAKPEKPKADPVKRLRKIAEGIQTMDGINPVRLYLKSRGLKPSRITQYHPSLGYYEGGSCIGKFAGMVHLFESPDGKPLTYHITYLTSSGEKADVSAPKKVMPGVASLSGGAIRLTDVSETIGIAEGIETALAATQQTGINCWAAYSATLLEAFEPPEGVRRVVIFGDNDQSFAGQKSAYALAFRLQREGYEVSVRIPDACGTDWADEVTA